MHRRIEGMFGWAVASFLLSAFAVQPMADAKPLQIAQTTEEIIKALEFPEEGMRKKGGTRGISVEALPSMSFNSIQFEFGSATLTPEAMRTLDNIAAALISDRLSSYQFNIVGHTDAVGAEEYNMELSRRRAEAVRDYLMTRYGIDGVRLTTTGLGERELADPTQPESGINRRVEVINLGS